MYRLVSILHELYMICITHGLVTDVVVLTQRRSNIIHVHGRSMWVRRMEGGTGMEKLKVEAGRRAHPRTEFTNRTEITEKKITVKTA